MLPRLAIAMSVLTLAACVPASAGTPPPPTAAPVPVYRGPARQPVDYARIVAAKQEADLAAFYAWASQQPPKPKTSVSGSRIAYQDTEYDAGTVERLILDTFGDAGPKALSVARCESRFDPTARNGQYRGIFQLGDYHRGSAERLGYTWDQMFEAGPNIAVAYDLWLEQGWAPWSCA